MKFSFNYLLSKTFHKIHYMPFTYSVFTLNTSVIDIYTLLRYTTSNANMNV